MPASNIFPAREFQPELLAFVRRGVRNVSRTDSWPEYSPGSTVLNTTFAGLEKVIVGLQDLNMILT